MRRRFGAFAVALLACAGCRQEMAHQAKLVPNGQTDAFPDGVANRPLPAGVVARGDVALLAALTVAPPVTDAVVARGIFCYSSRMNQANHQWPTELHHRGPEIPRQAVQGEEAHQERRNIRRRCPV